MTEAVAEVVSALELDDNNTRAEVRVRNSRVDGMITVGLMIDFSLCIIFIFTSLSFL